MSSYRCRRADSVSCLSNSLKEVRLNRISAAGRGLSLALGLVSMVIDVTGSEARTAAAQAAAENELGLNHRLADENLPASSRETTPLAVSVDRSAANPSTSSRIEGASHPRRTFLPATLQRFAATIILDSSIFDVLPGERGLTLTGPVGSGAAGTSLTRQRSLFLLNYSFEKRQRARFATFTRGAVRDMAGTPSFSGIPFEHQTGFRAALRPDLFHLVSTSAFGTNSPGRHAAAFTAAQESAFSGHQSSDALSLGSEASPHVRFEKRNWEVPARAAAAYPARARMVAASDESGTGGDTFASIGSPALALSSGGLASHLTFGTNGARLSGNGTIAGDVVLETSLGIAPGNSPGLLTVAGGLTWSQGGFFELEIQDPAGAPGTGWDAIHVNGILQFTATLGEPLTLHLRSLTASGAGGNISNFLSSRPYALQVLTATGGIKGFNPATVRITTTGFTNALDGGSFALLASGNNLMLTFTPVPEPSTWALMLTGASVLAVKLIRRRRRV